MLGCTIAVKRCTIVFFYKILARAQTHVLSLAWFVSRFSVAFGVIGEVTRSNSPLDLAECPKATAVPFGGAL